MFSKPKAWKADLTAGFGILLFENFFKKPKRWAKIKDRPGKDHRDDKGQKAECDRRFTDIKECPDKTEHHPRQKTLESMASHHLSFS